MTIFIVYAILHTHSQKLSVQLLKLITSKNVKNKFALHLLDLALPSELACAFQSVSHNAAA